MHQKKIFLSHNHKDKPVVEPIALRLRDIFGEANVFYDSWSIKPGDSIIEKMDKGLTDPDFVFFFMSENSARSEMVRLEWQNALFQQTRGECKIIPVRLDLEKVPAILSQTLYIDMRTNGMEATITQIVNVVQGNATFNPGFSGFSNLLVEITHETEKQVNLDIVASHYFEPTANFLILSENNEDEISGGLPEHGVSRSSFNRGIVLPSGERSNALLIASMSGGVAPKIPLKIELNWRPGAKKSLRGVLHQIGRDEWRSLPINRRASRS